MKRPRCKICNGKMNLRVRYTYSDGSKIVERACPKCGYKCNVYERRE